MFNKIYFLLYFRILLLIWILTCLVLVDYTQKVAFLASAVGPRIAASCAHAALAELSEDNSGSKSPMEAPGHGNR